MTVLGIAGVSVGTFPVPAPAQAAIDFNGDGKTDFVDFFLFTDAHGSTELRFDLDGKGTVDFAEFETVSLAESTTSRVVLTTTNSIRFNAKADWISKVL